LFVCYVFVAVFVPGSWIVFYMLCLWPAREGARAEFPGGELGLCAREGRGLGGVIVSVWCCMGADQSFCLVSG